MIDAYNIIKDLAISFLSNFSASLIPILPKLLAIISESNEKLL